MSAISTPPPMDSSTEPINSPANKPTDSPSDSPSVSPTDSSTDSSSGDTPSNTGSPLPTPIPTITAPPSITNPSTIIPVTATCSQGLYKCGCCSSGFECATTKCVRPPTTSIECKPNFFLCPDSLGGGCCPNGRRCARTTCEAQPTIITTSVVTTVLLPPLITTNNDGFVETKTPIPIVTQWVQTYTTVIATHIIMKEPPQSTILVRPNTTEPQVPPLSQQASSSRKLAGGAIGGIVGGGIIAVVVLLSAVIFTWRRLYARGNFDLPTGFGGVAFGGHRRKRGSGRKAAIDEGAVMSGTYDPHSPGGAAQRQQILQGSKFGRSSSGASGGGYRGATTLGGTKRNRGSDPFYPPGTTVAGSDGEDKSPNSPTIVSIQPVTPPVYYEADGVPLPPPPGPYVDMNPQGAYAVEIAGGEPLPLPVQRWQVTNPDLESVSSRAPSRVGHGGGDRVQVQGGDRAQVQGGDRVQVHPGTNF
ncbi:hypothetical protein EV426DRAFT_207201 [Tirmania nivea]|nr:hypothetical protein EV426DRAFT_207201 [Tirmania nivea]